MIETKPGKILIILVIAFALLFFVAEPLAKKFSLSSSLGDITETYMHMMQIDPSYRKSPELLKEYALGVLAEKNDKSEYEVKVTTFDMENNKISVSVKENYTFLLANKNAKATKEKDVIPYTNENKDSYSVTFYKSVTEKGEYDNQVKNAYLVGGETLKDLAPSTTPTVNGQTFIGWKIGGYESFDKIYTDISSLVVTGNMVLIAQWQEDSENVCTVTLYANEKIFDILKIEKGKKIGQIKAAPKVSKKKFKGWLSDEGDVLTTAQLQKVVVNRHLSYVALYK